ncbi:general secretion pathway protein GspK [Methylocella silvestris]|uniref:General secretion pathway protein GspK n=1 Tax=Methylocella silvestris TaxID=199596 RepID=A0A2J7TCK3_METSI|nr:type II secretion system protein GspK [Methylocella silvestris]PNG24501.1 general secretion pathway protein GspK [Methylocella silvestris]
MRRSAGAPACGETGFVLVAVLWILAALAMLASIYSFYASASAVAARATSDRLQAEALVSSALELTALRLLGRSDDDPRSLGEFQFRMGGAEILVTFRSEGGRIDLNAAPKDLLAGLFKTLGAKSDDADSFADRIIGWRKKGEAGKQNKEADLYKDAGLSYAPRQTPFQNIAELRFVLGLPPDLVESCMAFVTVFNGLPQIDVFAAAPEIVESLPHLNADVAATIVQKRGALDAKAILSLLGRAKDSVSLEPRKASRVNVGLRFSSGRRVNSEAVILFADKDAQPYRVLSWRDDFDGSF